MVARKSEGGEGAGREGSTITKDNTGDPCDERIALSLDCGGKIHESTHAINCLGLNTCS